MKTAAQTAAPVAVRADARPRIGKPPRNKKRVLNLLSNVQFLYELHLAKLELESFALSAQIAPNFRDLHPFVWHVSG